MIFRMQPAQPQMRAGMGYSSGAWGLGKTVTHPSHLLGYAPGARTFQGLGAVGSDMMSQALIAGYSTDDITSLSNLGATDTDIEHLLNGVISYADLWAQYSPSPVAATVYASGASGAQVVPGSTWNYTCSYAVTLTNFVPSASAFISKFGAGLGALGGGYSLSASNILQNPTLTGTVQIQFVIAVTGVGNALTADMKGQLDNLASQIVGSSGLTGSTLGLISSPSQGGSVIGASQIASAATDPISWLENNALYIGLFIGAIVAVNAFTGKRR